MTEKLKLLHVDYLPKELEPEILYVSKEFGVSGHLCPCGCGSKIITPLGQTEWRFSESKGKGTLYPSIGNWQLPCRSHYWIRKGKIKWSLQWSDERIAESRDSEESRRKLHYASKDILNKETK